MVAEKAFYHHIAVIGLGYVGLPVAVALAKKFDHIVGFDISSQRIAELQQYRDSTHEVTDTDLQQSSLQITDNADDLARARFFIVTVPTPINDDKKPDLQPLHDACLLIAPYIKKQSIIVFESTVYPGVSEEYCGQILSEQSGLLCGQDFTIGYSPERINPGDKQHRLENITKIVAGQDEATLDIVAYIYDNIIDAGLHKAPSIKVAEAAKAIENAQRDINIAFMNELAQIFDKAGINSKDVFAAAGTKWNFLPFTPGLVGGHCIGVDPYYLTYFAEKLGHQPRLILAGREINDQVGHIIGNKTIDLLQQQDKDITKCHIALLGLTFKENVPDTRNSRSVDIQQTLQSKGAKVICHDPYCDNDIAIDALSAMDAVVVAVAHDEYKALHIDDFNRILVNNGVIIDVKSIYNKNDFTKFSFWQY